jgi:tetratricopeptide (TPR) repeat protein
MDNPVDLQSPPDSDARLALLSMPDWTKLVRHFELGEGFALIVILLGDSSLAATCREELDLWLAARQRPQLFPVPITGPDDLLDLPERLLSIEPAPQGPIWIDGTGPRNRYESAWTRAAVKLNLTRNSIVDRFPNPLILVGPFWIREILRDTAPDFWSIRAFVAEISIPPTARALVHLRRTFWSDDSEFPLDPDFILQEAAALRGRRGQKRQLAELLTRAGRELMARRRTEEAQASLTEALAAAKAVARRNPEAGGDLHRVAIAQRELGDLMVSTGQTAKARTFYEKSVKTAERLLQLERNSDHLASAAITYGKTAHFLRHLGAAEQARAHFQRSIDILERLVREDAHRTEDLQSIAASYDGLGRVMLDTGDTTHARRLFENALAIDERLVREEPTPDHLYNLSVGYGLMGEVASSAGGQDEARGWYQKGLQIQQQLVQKHPRNGDYLQNLSLFLARVGTPEQLEEAQAKLAQLTPQQTPVTNKQ